MFSIILVLYKCNVCGNKSIREDICRLSYVLLTYSSI